MLALGEKIGLLQLLRFRIVRELLVWVFKKLYSGSDLFAVKVQGYGVNNHKDVGIECSAIGRSEADYKALITSEVATTLFTAGFASGVFHIEEIFSPEDMIAKLQEKGFHVDRLLLVDLPKLVDMSHSLQWRSFVNYCIYFYIIFQTKPTCYFFIIDGVSFPKSITKIVDKARL